MNEYVHNAHPLSPESLNSANMTPSTQQRRKRGFNRDPNDVFAKCGLTDIEAHELNAALKRSKADVLKASIVFLQQKKISIKKHNIIREATGLLKHQVFEELTVQSRWSSERARQLLSHPKVISNLHRRVTRAFGHKLRHSKISSDQATIDPAQLVGDIDVDSVKELLDTYGRSWSDPIEKSKQPSTTHIHLDDSHDDDIDAVEYQSSDSSEPKHTPRKSTRSIQKSVKPSFKRQRIESSEDEIEFERVDEKLQPQSNPSIVDDNPPHQNIIITQDEVAIKSFPKVTQQTVNRVVWHSYGTAISLINQVFLSNNPSTTLKKYNKKYSRPHTSSDSIFRFLFSS
eukprot:TRINITY_DN4495_c0_g1_i3.p1 TRINITY_DN4495_c0_g1~~TRINITY_DN4495_c0_g1_i3.p1  ORF type:complete len:343 (-),score=61.55 TRINITY_DN4495_c0_g1_i3:764-1792(-)